jgi:hypothetical protein
VAAQRPHQRTAHAAQHSALDVLPAMQYNNTKCWRARSASMNLPCSSICRAQPCLPVSFPKVSCRALSCALSLSLSVEFGIPVEHFILH